MTNQPPEFLIEGILPANEVHLLGGSSGSGKTTLSFQMLALWQQGLPIFGHTSYPVPYAYVSIDRSAASVERTLTRVGLQDRITRTVCREHLINVTEIKHVVAGARNKYPDAKFFIVEGYQHLAGDKGNNYGRVASLLQNSTVICAKEKITLLGICHASKLRTDESFQHPREVLLGSVAWAAYSETVITMNRNEATGVVTVNVLPRNAPEEKHEMRFGLNGVLEPVVQGSPKDTLLTRIHSLPVGYTVTTADLMTLGRSLGASPTTTKRAIRECLTNKVLAQSEQGLYQRTSMSPLKIVPKSDINIEE